MRRQAFQMAGFAGVVAAIQLTASLSGNVYHLTQLTMSAYYSLVVLGLCIVTRITSYNVCYTKLLRVVDVPGEGGRKLDCRDDPREPGDLERLPPHQNSFRRATSALPNRPLGRTKRMTSRIATAITSLS